jgi:hypothetical protein
MPAETGYVKCAETTLNSQCTVTCAAGYSGASTMYTCEMVENSPQFKPIGAVSTCELIKYVHVVG